MVSEITSEEHRQSRCDSEEPFFALSRNQMPGSSGKLMRTICEPGSFGKLTRTTYKARQYRGNKRNNGSQFVPYACFEEFDYLYLGKRLRFLLVLGVFFLTNVYSPIEDPLTLYLPSLTLPSASRWCAVLRPILPVLWTMPA